MNVDTRERNRVFQSRKEMLGHLIQKKSSGKISTEENVLLDKLIDCVNNYYCLTCNQEHFDNCLVREYQDQLTDSLST